jgi:type II secretory pathway pseudopilin PulG
MRHRRDEGFALVESVAACAIAAVAVVAITQTMAATSKANSTSRASSAATAFARAELEEARSIGYDDLAHLTGSLVGDPNVSLGKFDPDGTGPLPAENLIESPLGLANMASTETSDGIGFTSKTYVTDAPSAAIRVSVIVSWRQAGVARDTTVSSLIAPPTSPLAAEADAFGGQSIGGVLPPQVSSRSRRGGGREDASAASVAPVSGWTVTGASTHAEVLPASRHSAHAEIASATISQSGLTIVASGIRVDAVATLGSSITTTSSGTVTINGVPIVNPAPDTIVPAGSWSVRLNSSHSGADGSASVSFLRVIGPNGEDLRLGWAWVSPVTPW